MNIACKVPGYILTKVNGLTAKYKMHSINSLLGVAKE